MIIYVLTRFFRYKTAIFESNTLSSKRDDWNSYLYTDNNDRDYAGSDEHNSKQFLGREFKSITCRYRVE